jgi:hypothetical protein
MGIWVLDLCDLGLEPKPEGRNYLKDPGIDGRIILKLIFDRLDGGGGGMDWINLAQDRDRWQAVVNTMMNLQVP